MGTGLSESCKAGQRFSHTPERRPRINGRGMGNLKGKVAELEPRQEEGLIQGADRTRGPLRHEAQRWGQEKVTGKKLRIKAEDHSAIIITDSLGVTYPMWGPPNTHCPSGSPFVRSWDKTFICVISALPLSPFHR